MTLGEKIRTRRLDREMTLAQLARRAGVSLPTVSHIELGRSQEPSARNLYALAKALDTTVEELMEDKETS